MVAAAILEVVAPGQAAMIITGALEGAEVVVEAGTAAMAVAISVETGAQLASKRGAEIELILPSEFTPNCGVVTYGFISCVNSVSQTKGTQRCLEIGWDDFLMFKADPDSQRLIPYDCKVQVLRDGRFLCFSFRLEEGHEAGRLSNGGYSKGDQFKACSTSLLRTRRSGPQRGPNF